MENISNKIKAYSTEWFKQRAFDSLQKISDGVWDFSDSLLMYVPGSDEEYESIQQLDTPYHELVTKPERKYLEHIAEQIVIELPNEFEYIDLGPGTEHKEQFIFDAAKRHGKKFTYIPVDISDKFLEMSAEHASQQGILVKKARFSFEELPLRLASSALPRFVSLGLTYINYRPHEILALLKRIMGKDGYGFVNAHIRERVDMARLTNVYAQDVQAITKAKLSLLGLNSERDIATAETTDAIQMWATLKEIPPQLEKKGITPGSKLLIFQSLRYTEESFRHDVSAIFPSAKFFDTQEPFIGALLK